MIAKQTLQETDKFLSYLIYGICIEILVFGLCQVWLTYIPTPNALFIEHVYLYSLYLIYKIPSLSTDRPHVSIQNIIAHLQSKLFQSVPHLQAPKYLLSILLLYHFPAALGLFITYIILSLSYGIDQTETLLNIPMIGLSSFWCILNATPSPWTIPLSMATAAVTFTAIFSNIDQLDVDHFTEQLKQAWDNFSGALADNSTIEQTIVLSFTLLHLSMPFIRAIPIINRLYAILYAPPVLFTQMGITTFLLGQKCEVFLSVNQEDLDQAYTDAKTTFTTSVLNNNIN